MVQSDYSVDAGAPREMDFLAAMPLDRNADADRRKSLEFNETLETLNQAVYCLRLDGEITYWYVTELLE